MAELSSGIAVASGAKFDQAQARCQNDELAAIPIPAKAPPPQTLQMRLSFRAPTNRGPRPRGAAWFEHAVFHYPKLSWYAKE